MKCSILLTLCLPVVAFAQKPDAAPTFAEDMVQIPSGAFNMGHPRNDPRGNGTTWKVNEGPQREVTLDAFSIDRREITAAAWAEFLNKVGGETAWHQLQAVDRVDEIYSAAGEPETPIAGVSWVEAQAFCRWRGGELPTEAQWERAANGPGGIINTWPWGLTNPECGVANLFDGFTSCHDGPLPGGYHGARGASSEGVEDLVGNLEEWVRDHEALEHDPADTENPLGPAEGVYRGVRGASFLSWTIRGRNTARMGARPDHRSRALGFRCVKEAL